MLIRKYSIQLARLLSAIVVVLFIHNTATHGQPIVDWVKTGGTAAGSDNPSQLVRGPAGGFYLAGLFGADGASGETVLFKLDSSGQEISRQPWRGAYAHAVAVGLNGEHYLTGYVQDPDLLGVGQKYDFYLAKHAADG